ncbi:hypothetical protein WS86_24500 [Burkholderia savannae]|uniref:hypothetical protein n=1 Tax=Burkholderia savannae TaxID=1637837 RepID=UPI0007544636|nr:hypothetical protein [Burkholderia savannae]AOJ83791.1 hypothetical protein WS86_24500 [Burkholderia savannae]
MRAAAVAEVARLLSTVEPYMTTGESAEECAARGQCYVLERDGVPFLAWSLRAEGSEAFIQVAAGRAGFDLTEFGLALVERQAEGFRSIAFRTRRRGLVKKAMEHGFYPASRCGDVVLMRKELK